MICLFGATSAIATLSILMKYSSQYIMMPICSSSKRPVPFSENCLIFCRSFKIFFLNIFFQKNGSIMLRSTHSTSEESSRSYEKRRKSSTASILSHISESAFSSKERTWSVLDARVCLPAILNDPRHRQVFYATISPFLAHFLRFDDRSILKLTQLIQA